MTMHRATFITLSPFHSETCAIMNSSPDAPTLSTLTQLRADIPLTRDFIYLNSCTFGPVLQSVQRCMAAALSEENEAIIAIRGSERGVNYYRRAEDARKRVANMMNVAAEDVAWVYNTTTAIRLAIMSFNWQSGDKLAVTDVEHLSTHSVARGLAQHAGVDVTTIPTGDGPSYTPDYFLEQLDQHLTSEHRLLVMSHVSNIDGRRLPVAEAVRLARARGVKILVDGAQSLGVFPVDVQAIGADFYSGSVHKWLMGPPGIGFLVIPPATREWYNPHFVPTPVDQEGAIDISGVTAATLTELGTPNYALRLGAGHCIEVMEQIGLGVIEAQMRTLTAHLRDGLRNVPGIHLVSPMAWEDSSSVTTIQLDGGTPERCHHLIARLLDEYRIVVKYRQEVCGVRIGAAAFNTIEEIDQLLEGLIACLQV